MGFSFVFIALSILAFFSSHSEALPICLNQETPFPLKASLAFCTSYMQNDTSCCDAQKDLQLNNTFQSFNVSDNLCATYLKQLLCAECDPYAGDLFQAQVLQDRSVPVLCNSTSASNNISESNSTTKAYCVNIWDACQSVPIKNSPFATASQGASGVSAQNASLLTDLWQSQAAFCTALGGPSNSGEFCFSGGKYTDFNKTSTPAEIEGICFEQVGHEPYLNMIPHPDGTNRVFVSSQTGKIWLATVLPKSSGKVLELDETSPFLDISERVISSGEYGLLGLAFHPNFKENGRFFLSYNCDKSLWPDCAGRCACNSDAGCSLSDLGPEAGTIPCQITIVVAEYSANTTYSSPLKAVVANPEEVRRIFTMGLPYSTHHGGQLLFGPVDNYLYVMIGDGGSRGDPFNFAQKKLSLLGKILRLDVDKIPSASEILGSQLWGNYSIPADNPFIEDNSSQPEIWAYGLRNPWRCSFDTIHPSYFYCADVGQEKFEEVDLITKGGNYGWRVYEGTTPYIPPRSPGGNTSAASIQPIFPILEYDHASVNPEQNSASITGGLVSRSTKDACLYGRYVYGDLYGSAMWAAAESPVGSGNYTTTRVKMGLTGTSNSEPNFLYLLSFGSDNDNNLYALSAMGVFGVSDPKSCGFACDAELPPDALQAPAAPASSTFEGPAPTPHAATTGTSPNTSLGCGALPSWALYLVVFALFSFQIVVC